MPEAATETTVDISTPDTSLTFEQIRGLMLQRFPLIMIDKVVSYQPGKRITAVKNVSGNDIHFLGHFPGNAIMPGILIIEAMAQAAALLAALTDQGLESKPVLRYLGSVKAAFHKAVHPGDQMRIEVAVVRQIGNGLIVDAVVHVLDEVASRGELLLAQKGDAR
jgi:3-hydroxyacyl-[acyl-carrier-protein] dehydratase